MASDSPPLLLLFKQPSSDDDAWQTGAEQLGYRVAYQPLLRIDCVPPSPLAEALRDSRPEGGWSALVATSQNAVAALRQLDATLAELEQLRQLPCFAVGQATAAKLRAFGFRSVDGQASHTAAALAALVADFLGRRPAASGRHSVLFLAGAPRRDELPQALSAQHIDVREVVCYRSTPVEPDQLAVAEPPAVAVFFSPAGAATVFASPAASRALAASRLVAIGPTTAAKLRDCGGANVACCAAPTAASLCRLLASVQQPDDISIL